LSKCMLFVPFVVVATMAEMLYMFWSLITGNWSGAYFSIGVYVGILILTYIALGLLKDMIGFC